MTSTFGEWAQSDLSRHPCLSRGIDSDVHRVGDYVAKEYKTLPPDEVERYRDLQNAASRFLSERPYEAVMDLRGKRTRLVADRAVPVEWLGTSRGGRPLAFSRFIEATNLEKILWRPERFDAYADAELRDDELRGFAEGLNRHFWDEYPTRGQDELHYHVCMLSRRLDEALGVSGLYISKYNVKLVPIEEDRIDLVVTDLALYIERVRHGRSAVAQRTAA